MANLVGDSSDPNVAAVDATHTAGFGGSAAIIGRSEGRGVLGVSEPGQGVWGASTSSAGVVGVSSTGNGVQGDGGVGVSGIGRTWIGVYGETHAAAAAGSAGVWGEGRDGGDGVKGVANGPGKAAVCGFHLGNSGPGVFGQGAPAGHFQGDVIVTGDLVLTGADVAEQFDVTTRSDDAGLGPGSVVVLDDDGAVAPCTHPYDTRVAGVVSGAGDRVPALVLDRGGPGAGGDAERCALAVVGKVWCRTDATPRPIRVGDLLTTSSTTGHAMGAADRDASFGALIGKALSPLASGTGLVLVLVGLG